MWINIFNNIKNKLTTFVSYWFFSSSTDKEDFDNLNEDVEEVSNESKEPVVEEPTVEEVAEKVVQETPKPEPKTKTKRASTVKKTTKKT